MSTSNLTLLFCGFVLLLSSLVQDDPVLKAYEDQARSFTGQRNADWSPVVYLFSGDPVFAEVVLVPVGHFEMGSDSGIPNEAPVHRQTIDAPFWLDRTETTRAQYALCVEAGICTPALPSETSTQPAQPVNNITWRQARTYCTWRGMRLPTEREWEFAARGVESWMYPWGDDWQPDFAVWWKDNTSLQAAFVGSKPQGASWVGALDMAGNVGEWTSSVERYYPYTQDTHEAATSRLNRILRGGAFGTRLATNLRSAARFGTLPNAAYDGAGIRCARDSDL